MVSSKSRSCLLVLCVVITVASYPRSPARFYIYPEYELVPVESSDEADDWENTPLAPNTTTTRFIPNPKRQDPHAPSHKRRKSNTTRLSAAQISNTTSTYNSRSLPNPTDQVPYAASPKNRTSNSFSVSAAQISTTTSTPGFGKRKITMVVNLGGEMGNHLTFFMHSYAMKLEIEEQIPNVTIQLVGEHQNDLKWRRAANDLRKCFPNFKKMQFSSGLRDRTGEFQKRERAMEKWLKKEKIKSRPTLKLHGDNRKGKTESVLSAIDLGRGPKDVIPLLRQLLDQQAREPLYDAIQEPSDAKISLPYLRDTMKTSNYDLIEKYRTQIQQWMTFDKKACCRVLPDPDETVFHFRNFAAEGPRLVELGFVEVGHHHVVPLLLDSMASAQIQSTKVGLITRHYANDPKAAKAHINAIQKSGEIQLRVFPNQLGYQDFCVLLEAKHVVATKLSSYAVTAGILGNQTSVTLYTVDTDETRSRRNLFQPLGWKGDKDPTLIDRFRYKIYPEEYGNLPSRHALTRLAKTFNGLRRKAAKGS